PDGTRTWIQHLPPILRAVVPIERQSPTVVAELADEKVAPAVPGKVKGLDKDRPEQRVDQDSVESQRVTTGKTVLHETAPGLVIGAEDAGFQHQDVLVLYDQVGRRTAQCECREQPALPVEDQQSVGAGLTDKYSLDRKSV